MPGQQFRVIHATWLEQEKEQQRDAGNNEVCMKGDDEGVMTAQVSTEMETPVAFAPQDPPTAGVDTPFLIFHDMVSSETSASIPATALSSPTLSVSTVSDLTPTELGEEPEMTAHHDTFYFEDGNVEIVCGGTVFRVHSTTISFSSSKLRDLLSPSALLSAPMPEGCPRIVFTDSPEDFAVLLKMIHTPGWVVPSL